MEVMTPENSEKDYIIDLWANAGWKMNKRIPAIAQHPGIDESDTDYAVRAATKKQSKAITTQSVRAVVKIAGTPLSSRRTTSE